MQNFTGGHELEIIHQRAIRLESLRTHAGTARNQILLLYLRKQTLQGSNEDRLRERTPEFVETIPPMLPGHAPEARESKRRSQVAQADIGVTVALACKRKDGVGAGIHVARDAAREVHAKKRKARVGNRID